MVHFDASHVLDETLLTRYTYT